MRSKWWTRAAGVVGCLLCVCGVGSAGADDGVGRVHVDQNRPGLRERANWGAWNEAGDATIVTRLEAGVETLVLSSPSTAAHYLTPMIDLKPIPVTAQTVISFDIRCPVPAVYKINLTNQEEDAWYILHYQAEADEWVTVRKYVLSSMFNRNFRSGHVINDGMLGDHLIRVQIEARGEVVQMRNFRVFEATRPLEELPPPPALDASGYERTSYPQFQQDGFFPFGVILTTKAGIVKNAGHLGQDPQERLDLTLLDIKRHGFNTISNFADESRDVEGRLARMERYRLNLFETLPAYLELLGEHEALADLFTRYSDHPRLLGWYGRDEPRDLQLYLDAKKVAARLASQKPYSSAFDVPFVIRALGPYMEIVMTDLYPLTPHVDDPVRAMVERTAGQIRLASGTGARVWSIHQAFSLRRSGNQHALRYPTREEIRFDFFNALAAGSEGLFYFIYQDEVPFLDGQLRREEFDVTLVDAWFNPTDAYEELAQLSETWLPVLPSMLGASEATAYKFESGTRVVKRSASNGHGQWWVVVNGDLNKTRSIPAPKIGDNEALYDPGAAGVVSGTHLSLRPGEGRVLLATDPERWAHVAALIEQRRAQSRLERLQVEHDVLTRAGVQVPELSELATATGDEGSSSARSTSQLDRAEEALKAFYASSHPKARELAGLREIREVFGAIHRGLVAPQQTERYDGKSLPEYEALFAEIRQLSARYFSLLSQWRHGEAGVDLQAIEALRRDVEALQARVAHQLAKGV